MTRNPGAEGRAAREFTQCRLHVRRARDRRPFFDTAPQHRKCGGFRARLSHSSASRVVVVLGQVTVPALTSFIALQTITPLKHSAVVGEPVGTEAGA